jgi:hypothetical protein
LFHEGAQISRATPLSMLAVWGEQIICAKRAKSVISYLRIFGNDPCRNAMPGKAYGSTRYQMQFATIMVRKK